MFILWKTFLFFLILITPVTLVGFWHFFCCCKTEKKTKVVSKPIKKRPTKLSMSQYIKETKNKNHGTIKVVKEDE